jgi:UPF0755 protein
MKQSAKIEIPWESLWPVFLLFILTNSFFLAFFYFTLSPGRQEAAEVHIPAGSSLHEISDILIDQRVVKSPRIFEFLCKIRGLEKSLRAGMYVIPPGTAPWQVISLLTTGQGEMIRITLPEGLTNPQIFDRLTRVLERLDREKLARLADGDSLAGALGIDAPSLMGYLFPDTYFVPGNIDEPGILHLMVERFQEIYNGLMQQKAGETKLTRHQTVILASIIEKEAVADKERPVISSVFLNRLSLNRPLESCATVLFVLGKHKYRLLYRDLQISSPYNTYLHSGLPPGPICNPGKASLYAALFPAETDYLYFVARGDGTHEFSHSLDDHNRAKRRLHNQGPGG